MTVFRLKLSREETEHLIEMLYIAAWVIRAHRSESDARTTPYEILEQKIYAAASRRGINRLVDYVETLAEYYPTRELEENSLARTFINEYDDSTFWEELVDRLAQRDVVQAVGGLEAYVALDVTERLTLLLERENHYRDEIEQDGLMRLQFKRR